MGPVGRPARFGRAKWIPVPYNDNLDPLVLVRNKEEEMKISHFSVVSVLIIATIALSGCGRKTAEPPAEEPAAAADLSGVRVAVLIAEGFHDGETLLPKAFLEEHGASVTVLGPEAGDVKAYNSEQLVTIERAVAEAGVDEFDALILPGGRGPSVLRQHEGAVAFAKAFMESGKPVAAICHGPQTLITAGVVEGRVLTCYADVGPEVTAAGGEYRDEEVVVDGNLITSRIPSDIPAFNQAILAALQR